MAGPAKKMRTVRLPVTLIVAGKAVPPGAPVSLPEDEAVAYVARWGEVGQPESGHDRAGDEEE